MNNRDRIVITGIGLVSSLGVGRETFWNNLVDGKSGIKKVSLFDTSSFNCSIAGEISDFNAEEYIGNKGLRYFDRSTRLVLAASKFAIDETEGFIDAEMGKTVGFVLGTAFGSINSISIFDRESIGNPNYVNPMFFPNTVINSPASQVSIRFGLGCMNMTVSTGFTASLDAIGISADLLRSGAADMLLAGGVEELCYESFAGFYYSGVLAKDREGSAFKPYFKDRDGIILGEGSAVLVMETLEHANKRGAKVLAEVIGYGTYCGPSSKYGTDSNGNGIEKAMSAALEDAGITAGGIDYISGSGNGSVIGDEMEIKAIQRIFGDGVAGIPISFIKSSVGECYGASGAIQTAASVLALINNKVPNLYGLICPQEPEGMKISSGGFNKEIRTVMVNCIDCKGINSSLIIKKLN